MGLCIEVGLMVSEALVIEWMELQRGVLNFWRLRQGWIYLAGLPAWITSTMSTLNGTTGATDATGDAMLWRGYE